MREGRAIEDWLREYREHADALRPHLLAAGAGAGVYAAAPPSADVARCGSAATA